MARRDNVSHQGYVKRTCRWTHMVKNARKLKGVQNESPGHPRHRQRGRDPPCTARSFPSAASCYRLQSVGVSVSLRDDGWFWKRGTVLRLRMWERRLFAWEFSLYRHAAWTDFQRFSVPVLHSAVFNQGNLCSAPGCSAGIVLRSCPCDTASLTK